MLMTLFPIVTLVRLLQTLKASVPMEVTLSGMVTLVRLMQSEKAPYPIEVTLSLIFKLIRVFLPKGLKLNILLNPDLSTLSGMVTLVRLLHNSKASLPMEVTLSGMTTLVILMQ